MALTVTQANAVCHLVRWLEQLADGRETDTERAATALECLASAANKALLTGPSSAEARAAVEKLTFRATHALRE